MHDIQKYVLIYYRLDKCTGEELSSFYMSRNVQFYISTNEDKYKGSQNNF